MESPSHDDSPISRGSPGPSWTVLIAIAVVICGTAALMARNVYYTEGEVMRGLYCLAVSGTALLLVLGFANRSLAAWLIVLCGGTLILWQANQQRRWAILHEEVVSIVSHVERQKQETGRYPATLVGHTFWHPEFKDHVSYSFPQGRMFISYYLNDPGISYWYREEDGFGYYAD